MFLAAFLIGLREGLEAALIVGILVAYLRKQGRPDVLAKLWWGVGLAVAGSVALGALFTFGAYRLSFQAQEIIGGTMSLVAVGMITWMVFWMLKVGGRMKAELEEGAAHALAVGSGWSIFWLGLISVGREGLETTLLLWGWALQPAALLGALAGIAMAIVIGYLMYRGMVRVNLGVFFAWMGTFLVVVAAGILAYGIHDLQEAGLLPGPFSGHPITPTDMRTGDVLVGPTDGPFWMASFPFGWAFDITGSIDPSGFAGALLKGVVGFTPMMSWLQVTAWAIYLAIVLPRFVAGALRSRAARKAGVTARVAAASTATTTSATTESSAESRPAVPDAADPDAVPAPADDSTLIHQ
ncbi:MAG: FTR1 family protein [Propionibacteriaceae bacterium]|nr:FTR1 family protein [Propionibacteriaceae bacterium]